MSLKFNDIAIGCLFRVLGPEKIGQRVVQNNGLYLKVGHNVSVNISDGGKDCIFAVDAPCRLVQTRARINYAEYESYKICAQGAGAR